MARRGRAFAVSNWRLQSPAGKAYAYHATSAHWVMANVERLSRMDFRDFFRVRVAEPLACQTSMGLPRDQQHVRRT
jgi:CubicO group peptidase (beta-lactamase class C family)